MIHDEISMTLLTVVNLFIVHQIYTCHHDTYIFSDINSGIGRHASEYLAHKYPDYTIFVGVRKLSDGENIVDSNKDCKNIYPVILDISDHQSVVKGIETIVKQLKDKNIELIALVNNAGVAQGCPFEYHPIEEIKKVFNVNVFGTMDLTQQLLPFLRKSRGRVITLSSIAGIVGESSYM